MMAVNKTQAMDSVRVLCVEIIFVKIDDSCDAHAIKHGQTSQPRLDGYFRIASRDSCFFLVPGSNDFSLLSSKSRAV